MDGRKNNGCKPGEDRGQGRKKRNDEQKLIESLNPYHDEAIQALAEGIKAKKFPYIKLFFEYFYGKPKQSIDVTTNGENINENKPTEQQIAEAIQKIKDAI